MKLSSASLDRAPSKSVANVPIAATDGGPMVIHGIGELARYQGVTLGVSRWKSVLQSNIGGFGSITGDEQWVYTDPARAQLGPFGTTVQPGLLTLGMSAGLLEEVVEVRDVAVVVVYGLDQVRFPAPLRCGARFRMHVTLRSVAAIPGGVQVGYGLSYEVENEPKPCCRADLILRYSN